MSVFPLTATATVATFTLASAPAQAALFGSVTVNGRADLSYTGAGGLGVSDVFVDFLSVDGVGTSGNFSSILPDLSTGSLTIQDLTLAPSVPAVGNNAYVGTAVTSFLDFGSRTLGGSTNTLTFDLDAAPYTVSDFTSGSGPNVVVSGPGASITGRWVFGSQTVATGAISATDFGQTGSYTVSVEAVPEPLTILGTGIALGFGGLFKVKKSKKQSAEV